MRSNAEWRHWGQVDPLWAVDSRPGKQAGSGTPWTDAEFLARGEQYFSSVLPHWQQYGIGRRRCIEIGCGAGRITRPLLGVFDSVVAIDVSPEQIQTSRRLLGDDAARVDYHIVTAPRVNVPAQSCDGMYSTEVFQHFSDFWMLETYLREVFQALQPGGTICFQAPVLGIHPRSGVRYVIRRIALTIARTLGWRRMMEYRHYSAPRVFGVLKNAGFTDIELRAFPVAHHDGPHAYFLARKAGRAIA